MAGLVRTTDATLEPVSLQEQKDHARILNNYEDDLLRGYITTARVMAENRLGQAFVTQTWTKTLDRFPPYRYQNPHRAIYLDRPPLQSVTSVTYVATDGTSTVLPSSSYYVVTGDMPGYIAPVYNSFWPVARFQPNAVTIVYKAGYGGPGASVAASDSVDAVPVTIKQGIKLLAQHYFQVRDVDAPMPQAIESLLGISDYGAYRIPDFEDNL